MSKIQSTRYKGSLPEFSGSYELSDVIFLLKPIDLKPTELDIAENMMQSGACHYSEIVNREYIPGENYLQIFNRAFTQTRQRVAREILSLAHYLDDHHLGDEIVLVSLARAGTPVGVLLKRALDHLNRKIVHYSISIIRDRGLDVNALDAILANHKSSDIYFVDGWTGKGSISKELRQSLDDYNAKRVEQVAFSLIVLADLCHKSTLAATDEDYLIPSAILNSTVSGLVSRTVLNDKYITEDDFHGCIYYKEFEPHDLSKWFVDEVEKDILELKLKGEEIPKALTPRKGEKSKAIDRFVDYLQETYNVSHINLIKPGIGESTRALLRRIPDRVLIKDVEDETVQSILYLARKQGVPIEIIPDLQEPYKAVTLIKSIKV